MNIGFSLRKAKKNKAGEMPVMVMLYLNSKSVSYSTGLRCLEAYWDKANQRAKERGKESENSKRINSEIDKLRSRFRLIEANYNLQDRVLSMEEFESLMRGESKPTYTLLSVFEKYRAEVVVPQLASGQIGAITANKWKVRQDNLTKYLQHIGRQDLLIDTELTRGDFDKMKNFYLSDGGLSWNYVCKLVNSTKTVLQWAMDNEYTKRNPFAGFTMRTKPTDVDWLEIGELTMLEAYSFASPTLQRARDFFLFCCYTGLSFTDYDTLASSEVRLITNPTTLKVDKWIVKQREKGKNHAYGAFEVPIFAPALAILERYGTPEDLPRMTNPAMNRMLKEIGALVGKGLEGDRIHCHLARHTFIYWALNIKCLSRESVARMVGHTDTKMLNKYAPITIARIQHDLADKSI